MKGNQFDPARYARVIDADGVEHVVRRVMGGDDEGEGERDLAAEFQQELTTIQETLKTFVSDEASKKHEETSAKIAEIQEQLNKAMANGDDPDKQDVVDAEKKMAELEETVRGLVLKAESVALAKKPEKEERDAALFKGLVIKDMEGLKKALYGYSVHPGATSEEIVRSISTDLFSTGGKLSGETEDRFLDFVMEKTVALSRVRTRRMMSPQAFTDELTVSRRRWKKAVEATDPGTTGAIGTKRRELNTVEGIWAEDISQSFLEDNIERAGAEGHIMQIVGRQVGSDLNDLAWNGDVDADVSQDDAFLSINNGWIKLMLGDAEVNDVDAASLSSPSNSDILSEAFQALPVEFKGVMDLAYFVPVGFAEEYAEQLSARATNLGDQVMVNGFPVLRYFGWPVIAEPHLYEDNSDRLVLTPLMNLHHGIQRGITVQSEWRPRKRAIEVTITARNDYEYATGKGAVLVSNIPAANL